MHRAVNDIPTMTRMSGLLSSSSSAPDRVRALGTSSNSTPCSSSVLTGDVAVQSKSRVEAARAECALDLYNSGNSLLLIEITAVILRFKSYY